MKKSQKISRKISHKKVSDGILPKGFIPRNIYKVGSAAYYRDVMDTMSSIRINWDGYNPQSTKQMRELLEDIVKIGQRGLNNEKMYWGTD